MRRLLGVAVALALAVIVVAGCGSGSNAFPTGKWTGTGPAGEVAVMEYGSDGRWSLSIDGIVDTSGTYSTDANTFTFLTDTYCKGQGAEQGTYTWASENNQLTFKKQTDACDARIGAVSGGAWTPVK